MSVCDVWYVYMLWCVCVMQYVCGMLFVSVVCMGISVVCGDVWCVRMWFGEA